MPCTKATSHWKSCHGAMSLSFAHDLQIAQAGNIFTNIVILSNSMSIPVPIFGVPLAGPAIISTSILLSMPGMILTSCCGRLGSVSSALMCTGFDFVPLVLTITLVCRCDVVAAKVGVILRIEWVDGRLKVTDCCVKVSEAGISRLKWVFLGILGARG